MTVLLSPVGGVAAQFLDNNGNPLSGGKLFSYSAGTTTPAATFTSSLGVTPHTNPIVLDSGGRVPGGETWLTDGVIYKFVLQTSTNVLIATYDNIVGINSNFVNYTTEQEIQTATAGQTVFDLTTMQYQPGTNSLTVYVDGVNQYGPGAQYAYLETDSDTVTFVSGLHVGASVKFTTATQTTGNATDASVVSYDPPFTNAVGTNVEDKLAQTVSVKDFGAVCDGVADDTVAVQTAINYCLTDPLRPISLIVPGQCKLTAPINIDQVGVSVITLKLSDFRIIGLGKMAGFFVSTPIVMFSATANHSTQSVSSNISFEGLVFESSDRTINAFVMDGAYIQVKFQNCRFDQIKCMNTTGINTFSYSFLACEMRNWDGVWFDLKFTTANDITISNCYANGGYNLVDLGIVQTFTFVDNTVESLQGRPITLSGGRGILIAGNYFEANRSALGQAYEVDLASGGFPVTGSFVTGNLFYLDNTQVADPADFAVNYGQPVSAVSSGNFCTGKMNRTVSPTIGSFMSFGDADNKTNTVTSVTTVLSEFQGLSLTLATTGRYQQINNYNVQTVAVTKAFDSDLFNAAATTDNAVLFTQPAQSLLLNVVMVNELLFVAPSMTDLDISVGDGSDDNGILNEAMNLTVNALNTKYKNRGVYWNGGAAGTEYYTTTAKAWSGYATATGANLNTLTAGQVTFYFTYRSL